MKRIVDFETNEPLFSEKEMHDVISLVTMCITEATKTKNFNCNDWKEYIKRWNQVMCLPEETIEHIDICVTQSLNALDIHE